eukprot:TRINITY_DN6799_c0_g1_i1.p1 TRINITY_DN6799_c0_g1~~TRINITY_DN6799_c0_g1_i1.p1  ORF type:complete len:162 (-),score=40.22 TRINITY_DN6799_c0_g1_i1:93-578(-)
MEKCCENLYYSRSDVKNLIEISIKCMDSMILLKEVVINIYWLCEWASRYQLKVKMWNKYAIKMEESLGLIEYFLDRPVKDMSEKELKNSYSLVKILLKEFKGSVGPLLEEMIVRHDKIKEKQSIKKEKGAKKSAPVINDDSKLELQLRMELFDRKMEEKYG